MPAVEVSPGPVVPVPAVSPPIVGSAKSCGAVVGRDGRGDGDTGPADETGTIGPEGELGRGAVPTFTPCGEDTKSGGEVLRPIPDGSPRPGVIP